MPEPLSNKTSRYIDSIELYESPSSYALRLIVHRQYVKAQEELDVRFDEPWVKWQRVKNRTEE